MSVSKRYLVRVAFREQDPKTGELTSYQPGDTYFGSRSEVYLTGVDDPTRGRLEPLITEPDNKSGADRKEES